MLSLTLVLLAAPPPSQAQQFAQQMCEYYVKVLQGVSAGDAALKSNDTRTAQRQYQAAQRALEQGVQQLDRAKAAGVFPDDVKMKCAAGSFTGASLKKTFLDQAKAFGVKVDGLGSKADSAGLSDAQKMAVLSSIGKTLDAVEKLEQDTLAAQQKDAAKAVRELTKCGKTYQWIVETLAHVEQHAKVTKADTVPTKAGPVTREATAKRAAAAQARVEKAVATAKAEADKQTRLAAAAKAEAEKQAAAKAEAERQSKLAAKGPTSTTKQPTSAPSPTGSAQRAEPAPQPLDYVTAATFAAGRCTFGKCATNGWESNGTVTTCNFNACLKNGWQTRHPDGRVSSTSCNFNSCLENGWDTQHPDGETSRTSCNFNDCATHGWDTDTPAGVAQTTCNFNACFKDGWDTQLPGRGARSCSCDFNDCLENGASCD